MRARRLTTRVTRSSLVKASRLPDSKGLLLVVGEEAEVGKLLEYGSSDEVADILAACTAYGSEFGVEVLGDADRHNFSQVCQRISP